MKQTFRRIALWMSGVLLAGVVICYAILPWDEYGMFQAGYSYYDTDVTFPTLTGSFINYFETTYGTFPQFMIWEDTDLPSKMNVSISFVRPRKAPTPPWNSVLSYAQVRTHLYWRIESVKTGAVFHTPIQLGIADTTNLVWDYGWTTGKIIIDLRDLPIPNDGSAYLFQPVVFEGEPIGGKEVYRTEDPWTIIRSKRETPYDSLAWAYYGGQLEWNKDVATALLQSFPSSRAILYRLVLAYSNDENCDSLRWAARKYLDAVQPGADSLSMPVAGFENLNIAGASTPSFTTAQDFINQKLMSVCGDTLLEE
ncbi:hypothetical protein KQI63_08700 [bacterium]|nr:hypothetical protein [bacterium]